MCMCKCVRSCVRVYVCLMEFSSPLALEGRSRPQGFSPIKGPFSGNSPVHTHLLPSSSLSLGRKETGPLYQDPGGNSYSKTSSIGLINQS